MKRTVPITNWLYFFISILLITPVFSLAQTASDGYGTAPLISSVPVGATCTGTPSTTLNGTSATWTNIANACTAGNRDMWYRFVAKSTNPTVSFVSATLGNARVQIYADPSTLATSHGCGASVIASPGLTIGNTYYIRIYSTTSTNTGNFSICIRDPTPLNDNCSGATLLTSGTACTATPGNMQASTLSAVTIATPGCGATATYDVWYTFVAQTTNPTITLAAGSGFTAPNMQLLSNDDCAAAFTALYCGTTSIAADNLAIGTTYYIRVYSSAGTAPANALDMDFDICVTDPVTIPFNDECVNAINLQNSAVCENYRSSIAGATLSSTSLGACAGPATYDVWFKFTAITTTSAVNLSSGTNNFTNRRFQILSGACGSLTSRACGVDGTEQTFATTIGQVYYIRVYSTTPGAAPNGNSEFDICVRGVNANIRFGNSYVNISKKTAGGVVQTGDTLEIRMTINHKSGTLFNARYVDNIPTGTVMLTGPTERIRIITNEGLTYKAYTLAASDDGGTYRPSPLAAGQYNVRLNLALGAYGTGIPAAGNTNEFASATGRVLDTHNPRGGGGVLFAIAYRVRVTAATGALVTLSPGQFIYRTTSGGPDITLTATPFQLLVTNTQTLCSNSIGLNNAVEQGGTFGNGTTLSRTTDLTTPIPGYSFMPSVSMENGRALGDGKYAIVKNISPRSGTQRNARRVPNCSLPSVISINDPNSCENRMWSGHWDVDGDHSGTNDAIGNLPPASSVNSGYMLLVNADFVASEAYRQTINNLCPNTYYEFSSWVRNVCTTCGADSLGRQFDAAMPSAIRNGYVGVYPNLSFAVDGVDYYSTGEIDATGWQKRGFVIRTGPSQTSATFTIRNNSQGGGGNDWAMDDISVSTCLPTMRYSPSNNPTLCTGNTLTISDTVRSIYNTYTNYKWQRSTDGGTTWADITTPATAIPVLIGSEYQYVISRTLTPAETQLSNNGDLYRVIVSTTAANLSNSSCNFTDGSAIINLRVIDCGNVLDVKLLSFSGKLNNGYAALTWSTSQESAPVSFDVEKSTDGINYHKIATVKGYENASSANNYYALTDSIVLKKTFYRLALITGSGRRIQSHTVVLQNTTEEFDVSNVVNPFTRTLSFDVTTTTSGKIEMTLLNASGHTVKKQSYPVTAGVNNLLLRDVSGLSNGVYILQVQQNGKIISKKVIKQ